MSLEEKIDRLTKAMEKNNELLEKNIEGRNALVAKVDKSSKPEAAAPAKKTEKAEKPAKSSKEIDDKTIRKAFGDFMQVSSEKLRDKRKDFVAALLEEFGADTIVDIEQDDRARAMKLLEKKLNGEDVKFGDDDSDEDDAPKAKKKAPAKKKPADDDDDEDEDDSDSDDEDEDEDE